MKYNNSILEQTVKGKGYKWFSNGDYNLNLVGIRNSDTKNKVTNAFDDTLTVSYKVGGKWKYHEFDCTTDPGTHWVKNILKASGVAILKPGQYRGSPGASMGERGKIDSSYNFYESIEKSAPFATHIRAKIYRIGTGKEVWLDYDRIMKIFSKIQYNGWLSVVYEGQDEENEETAIPKSVVFLREMIKKYNL